MIRATAVFAALTLCLACARQRSAGETSPPAVVSPSPEPATPAPAGAAASVYDDLLYLADDARAGRRAGTPGNVAAADYIADAFRRAGAVPVGARGSMRTSVPLIDRDAVQEATLGFGESRTSLPDKLLPLTREAVDITAPVTYLTEVELESVDEAVAGHIVVTEVGSEATEPDVRAWLALSRSRAEALAETGAVALVEVYRSGAMPFGRLVGGINRAGMALDEEDASIPMAYVKAGPAWDALRRGEDPGAQEASLRIVAPRTERLTSDNVVAVLPGTDASVADEYVAVTAHFDHIGVTPRPGLTDSINNGARDNGMGTAALLEVARRWRANPGRRPLLLMAWTAEEEGLLGSAYWAAHPTVPLEEVAFNFNMDGAGYTDTTAVVLNGYDFTTAQGVIDAAVAATGLTPREDPVPQYGLYRASDNYKLAERGIPAVNMAPGFEGFTDELMRYYHQPADEAQAVSPTYLQKYADAAVAAVRAVADAETLDWNRDNATVGEYVELDD